MNNNLLRCAEQAFRKEAWLCNERIGETTQSCSLIREFLLKLTFGLNALMKIATATCMQGITKVTVSNKLWISMVLLNDSVTTLLTLYSYRT